MCLELEQETETPKIDWEYNMLKEANLLIFVNMLSPQISIS